MIQCPECRALIPDDSVFCDQCGKELKWCPQCGRPKRGTECPVCGSPLGPRPAAGVETPDQVGGDAKVMPDSSSVMPDSSSVMPDSSSVMPDSSSVMPDSDRASCLAGNGWRLALQSGAFGRRGGIWPELATNPYVSGNHGVIGQMAGGWTITDSGSTNGTYVNDKRLEPGVAVELKIGDRVRIATLEFTVE